LGVGAFKRALHFSPNSPKFLDLVDLAERLARWLHGLAAIPEVGIHRHARHRVEAIRLAGLLASSTKA